MPFGKPSQGRVSFIRFIRSDLQLEIFGQRFPMPPEASYENVRATIDVALETMTVVLHGETIQTHAYTLDSLGEGRPSRRYLASFASLRPFGVTACPPQG